MNICAALLALLLACWSALVQAGPEQAPIQIDEAQVLIEPYRAQAIPPDDASEAWRSLSLEHRVPNPSQELVRVWFRMTFDVNGDAGRAWAVMLPRLYSGGSVFVNGVAIGEVPGSSPTAQANWLRPHQFPLPAGVLQPGENTLLVGVPSRYDRIGLGAPIVGTAEAIRSLYAQRTFWEYTIAMVSVWLLLMGGIFLLAIWFSRRQEVLYGIFGLATLAWGIRTIHHVWPVVPLDLWVYWRAIYYAGTGFGDILICIFLMRTGGFQHRWIERSALLYAAIGPLAMLAIGQDFQSRDYLWYGGAMPLNLLAVGVMARAVWRRQTWDTIALAGAMGMGVLAFVRDYAIKAGWLPYGSVYTAHAVAPLVIIAICLVLVVRFIQALHRLENVNVEMERRLRVREAEINANHEVLRQMELAQASAVERQRIMQDMHDGLGSQLLSSLAVVQRGGTGHQEIAGMLQECIDDMRLVVDALTPEDNDLLAALGTLRFRMAPRLAAAGIELDWQVSCPADSLELEPREGLAVLRIVQEAISNVLKHAGASRLAVTIDGSERALEIRIVDNGRGFTQGACGPGRGLGNMNKRAAAIGASLGITSFPGHTQIRLFKPRSEQHA